MSPNPSMITNTMRTGTRTARSLRICRALTFSPGPSIGGEASGARRDLLGGLFDQPDLTLAERVRLVRIDVEHAEDPSLPKDRGDHLRAGVDVAHDVARPLPHVWHDLGLAGCRHGPGHALAERDAFVLGGLAAERPQDQRVPVHEIDAHPVESWLLFVEACYGSVDELEIQVHVGPVYRPRRTRPFAPCSTGGGGCREGNCPHVPLPAVAAPERPPVRCPCRCRQDCRRRRADSSWIGRSRHAAE